jgi:hypothetical protein
MNLTGNLNLVAILDSKIDLLVKGVEQSPVIQAFTSPDTPRSLALAIMKNIMLETYSYGRFLTEATATAIGRLGMTATAL